MRSRNKLIRHDEDAQAVIEFALIVTVLLLIFLGTVDYSRFLYYDTAISNAARVGAESAINHCIGDLDSNVACGGSGLPTTDDQVMWSVYCEARPYDQILPSYGVLGSAGSSLGPGAGSDRADRFIAAGTRSSSDAPDLVRPDRQMLRSVAFTKQNTATPIPTNTPTNTPGPSPTPTRTSTPGPTSTATATNTPGPTPTLAPSATPGPTNTPIPASTPAANSCEFSPGTVEQTSSGNIGGDVCVAGCQAGNTTAGQDCSWDICVAPPGPRSSDSAVTVYVGYRFKPISFAISLFFHDQQCYSGDSISQNHHNLCASSSGTISP